MRKNQTYQNILFDNVQKLASFVNDKQKHIQFEVPFSKMQRNDLITLQQCILTMTSAERKRLGISKSGLWYQKKKLASGSSVRLYGKVLKKLGQ